MESNSGLDQLNILVRVKDAAVKRILFLPHAVSQMNSPERMVSTREVRAVIRQGVVIEDYPEDVRGHSCLMLGWGEEQRPLHVLCAPKPDYLAIITVYLPNPDQWEQDWQTRRKR